MGFQEKKIRVDVWGRHSEKVNQKRDVELHIIRTPSSTIVTIAARFLFARAFSGQGWGIL